MVRDECPASVTTGAEHADVFLCSCNLMATAVHLYTDMAFVCRGGNGRHICVVSFPPMLQGDDLCCGIGGFAVFFPMLYFGVLKK